MSAHGPAHDPYETRGRLQGAEASDEFARWRELPPRLHGVEPPPLPLDLARLLHRLRLRYVRQAGPAILARAREEGWDHAHLLEVLFAEEAAGRDRSTREMHRKAARLPSGADEAEALYRLVDAAYERRSLIVTSNLHPARFDSIFPKGLATAAVDRLLHHAHVIVTDGRSHRLAEALDGRGVASLAADQE